MAVPRILQPLGHRDFALLWAGQTLSLLGTFMSNVAYPFQILRLGGSARELGTLFAIFGATVLVFLLVGGAVVDRVSRRSLLIVTDTIAGLVMLVVAVLGLSGVLEIWHLYVSEVFLAAAFSFAGPAASAIIPELVPEDVLVAGNALRGLGRQISRLGGPVIGGLLVALVGPAWAFAIDAVSFFVSAGAVALTVARPALARASTSIVAEIREGFGFVFGVQWLWVTIFGWSLVNAAFIGAMAVGLPLLVTEVLGAGAVVYGIINAATGVGEAAGAVLVAHVRIRRVGVAMYLFATVSGLALMVFGLVPILAGALVAAALVGFSFVGFGVLWESSLQRLVPRRLLGRVTSVDWFGGTLLGPVAPLAAAFVVERTGPAELFVLAGAISTTLTLLGLALPSIRRLE